MLTFGSSVIMFIEYLMVLIVCGCKCREFFLISNTSRQLFSRAKSLISKDIKFFPEATFSRVKYRYNDSFIIIIFTETLTREFARKSQIFELKSQNRKLNSLLCEIFTYLAVKIAKLQTLEVLQLLPDY